MIAKQIPLCPPFSKGDVDATLRDRFFITASFGFFPRFLGGRLRWGPLCASAFAPSVTLTREANDERIQARSLKSGLTPKSLVFVALVFLFQPIPALAGLCLTIDNGAHTNRTIPATAGDQLRIHFKHSIYGSAVDEILTVRAQGLQLTELRYGEARLVEFYGHEQAYRHDNVWVVRPEPVIFPTLSLRVSDATAMVLSVPTKTNPFRVPVSPASALRIRVNSCKQGANG